MINIILFEPEIPGNTGNVIRTAAAINAKLHIIKPIAFSLHPMWLKRASAGRLLSEIEHEVHESYKDFKNKYGDKEIHFITRYGLKNYSKVNFKKVLNKNKEIWIMFGKESTGIPKKILKENIDNCLRIPMAKEMRSLNLATTVMLIGYEIQRQIGFKGLSLYEIQKGKDFLLK